MAVRRAGIAIIAFLIAYAAASRKESHQPLAEPQQESKKAEALLLPQEIVREAERVTDPYGRLRIRLRAADLLWSLDEPGARALFERVMNEAATLGRVPDARREEERQMAAERQRAVFREILRTAARRDPRWAEHLIASLKEEGDSRKGGISRATLYQDLLGTLWDVSGDAALRDAPLLLEIAARGLAAGERLAPFWSLMLTAAAAHPELGDPLFRLILSRLPALAPPEDFALAILGAYLNRRFRGADSPEPLERELRWVLDRTFARAEQLWRIAQERRDPAAGEMLKTRETRAFIRALSQDYLPLFRRFDEPVRAEVLARYVHALASLLPSERPPVPVRGDEELSERIRQIEREANPRARDLS